MEVRHQLLDYVVHSSEQVLAAKVLSFFARDEHQDEEGDSPHVHGLFQLDVDSGDREAFRELEENTRGCLADVVRLDEIDACTARGLLDGREDWCRVTDLAANTLTHRTKRNMKRVGTGDDDVVMREKNNFFNHPDPTSHVTVQVDPSHSAEAISILAKCRLCDEPPVDQPRRFTGMHPQLECK